MSYFAKSSIVAVNLRACAELLTDVMHDDTKLEATCL